MGASTATLNTPFLLKGWKTLRGDHYCPACWKGKCKNLVWQKALELSEASVATISIVEKDEVIQACGYVLCIGCDTMILIRQNGKGL